MSNNRNNSRIAPTMRMLNLTDEQKLNAAVRCISGEPVEAVALEMGVSEDVIQGWVDGVSELVETDKLEANPDLEKAIAQAKGVCNRLQQQINARKKQIEMRETELRMLSENPPFMRGGGRR